MLMPGHTRISTQYLQVQPGRRHRRHRRACAKRLIEADDDAPSARPDARARRRASSPSTPTASTPSPTPMRRDAAGATSSASRACARAELEQAAATYAGANAVIGVYGMGLTQHPRGRAERADGLATCCSCAATSASPGAGICPVRGHSNVQGQRTVGITEKPELAPLDKLKELYGFEPPRKKGLNTVEACAGRARRLGQGLHRPRRQLRARGARTPACSRRPGASCA